jgi:DNA polymerase
MTTLWLDLESFSECDLKSAGTHRYAEDPSTCIIVAQWAIDDDDPVVVDCTHPAGHAPIACGDLVGALEDPTIVVAAHNSRFDRTILRHCWGIDVPIERWFDTMIQGMAHGLPGGLDKIGQIVGLEEDLAKDKHGRELIQLFCKPRPKNSKLRRATRETHPAEWQEFLEYSRQDIVAMRAISKKLPLWNYRAGHPELALWHLDQKINDRGLLVDLDLARAAIDAVAVEQKRLKTEIIEQTDGAVTNASRRDQLLKYILEEHGVTLPDMKADTLRRRLEDPELPEPVRQLIVIRLEATKTSTAKYHALVKATSADGRLRNTLQFAGAQRTARWAGRIFQPQNLPRPTAGFDEAAQEEAIEAIKVGAADLVYTDVMQTTSNCIRGAIIAPPGSKLVVADLANIEGRGLAWLAGERWKLRAFAEYDAGTGPDLYNLAYAHSFGVDVSRVTKSQRQIGKVEELAMGYEGGVAAFVSMAAVYGMDLDELADAVLAVASQEALNDAAGMWAWATKKKRTLGLSERVYKACETVKRAWRAAHPETVGLWAAAGDAVRNAIRSPGETFPVGQHVRARVDASWLRLRLPSGRYLCYINPKTDDKGQLSYFGVNQYTRQWGKIKTYGGKLVENLTQGFARDVMAANMPRIEEAGYEIVLTVHDELLTETPDTDAYSSDHLATLLSVCPDWAPGLPLAAAGFEAYRYRKD